ncbi:MAG: hypothetical protein IJL26_01660 [Clostridia bacterium]|nr:hypothetical protein [Clostridia bacterium]
MKKAFCVLLFLSVFLVCAACRTAGSAPEASLPRFDGNYTFSADGAEFEISLTASPECVQARFRSPAALDGLLLRYDGARLDCSLEGLTADGAADGFIAGTPFGAFLRQTLRAVRSEASDAVSVAADGFVSEFRDPQGRWSLKRVPQSPKLTDSAEST